MWTDSDFKVWLEEINYSSLSQEALKQAASKFYYKFGDLNKKTVLRCVEDFVKTDKNELTKVSHILFKEQGGTEGKMKGRFDIPPQNYCPKDFKAFEMRPWCQGAMMRCDSCDSEMSSTEEISEHIHSAHKETLKRVFAKEVLRLASDHELYREWLCKTHNVDFGGGSVSTKEIHIFKDSTEDESENKTTITRNLPSGSNIYETLTTRIKVNKDGTTKKTVITGQMANITTRKREYDANEDATEVKRKVAKAERRQAKNISNILNHVSGDDEKVQASLISKIIDKKGFEFADEVNRRSKALQENKKFSPEQTAALVTDWGNDNKLTKNIALFALKINLVFFLYVVPHFLALFPCKFTPRTLQSRHHLCQWSCHTLFRQENRGGKRSMRFFFQTP